MVTTNWPCSHHLPIWARTQHLCPLTTHHHQNHRLRAAQTKDERALQVAAVRLKEWFRDLNPTTSELIYFGPLEASMRFVCATRPYSGTDPKSSGHPENPGFKAKRDHRSWAL